MSKTKGKKPAPGTLPDDVALLKVQELAIFWGVHIQTVHRWIREGRLPVIPVGSDYRIKREIAFQGVPREA